MKMKKWGVILAVLLGPVVVWGQPSTEKEDVVNRVMAVVGTTVITQYDVAEYRVSEQRQANAGRRMRLPETEDLVLTEMVNNALLIHEIRNRKGFVMPAGLGDRLLAGFLRRSDKKRSELIQELQGDGITLEQFETDLINRALLQANLDPIWEAVHVSPKAVETFFNDNPKQFDLGEYADILAFAIPASEEGVDTASMKTLVAGIGSIEDFQKLTKERKVANDGERVRVYKKFEATHHVNSQVTAELFLPATKVGKATFYKDEEVFHVMFLKERGKELKRQLEDPKVQQDIKLKLWVRQYHDRLNHRLQRLRQTINVYRPGGLIN